MISICMHGCNGKMGRVISQIVAADPSCSITCGVDLQSAGTEYPVYSSVTDCQEPFDVVIDFSTAAAVDSLLAQCISLSKPLVLCTTGLSGAQRQAVAAAAAEIPIFYSANMSLGVNLITALCRKAASVLAPAGFDIEIVERHHNQKIDAPSGTALSIAESLKDELGDEYFFELDRPAKRQKRDPKEIGISAVRGGTIVGEHTVLFAGRDDLVEIKHTALSKEIFAIGAVNAAKFLLDKAPGLYDMTQLIG